MDDEAVEVSIGPGRLRGRVRAGIRRFLGIPYAAPPFGDLRFRAPQPVEPWTDVREAAAFGPTAPQAPYDPKGAELLHSVFIEGTDILTANVWTPVGAERLPVVLWIHGGALQRGTAALSGYDGTTFARDGVVFVSINYRLGAEGFSVLSDAPLNLGLRDAVAALAWVQREIEAFGGDPDRITLMGESAGGGLVAALLARPDSRAMVAGAIIQSGPLEAVAVTKAARASAAIAKKLGVAASREAFTAIAAEDLVAARTAIAAGSSPLSGAPGFMLALDPESLPTNPEEALVEVEVPLLIGTNTDEYRLWLDPPALAGIGRVKAWGARRLLRIPERAATAVRRAFPEANPGEVLGQLLTDRILRAPMSRLAGRRTAPTWCYEFAWPSPIRDLRAAHAVEIGFAFDRLDDPDALALSGPEAPRTVAQEMHAAWVAFITTGDPGWPVFAEGRSTRILDTVSRTAPQRRREVLDALG